MAINGFRVIVELYDSKGKTQNREECWSQDLVAPTHIKAVGLNHLEQINLLQKVMDVTLPYQFVLIEEPKNCPLCGKPTRKNGTFTSHFHAVYTDHKISLQRYSCTCGWKNKYTVDGKFGTSTHTDLLKIQCELGADHSFKKAETILSAQNGHARAINNHMHVTRLIDKIGSIVSTLKCANPAVPLRPTELLVAQVDGGYIQPKEINKRGYEVLAAKFYRLDNLINKNKHHSELKQSTCVASALLDNSSTISKQIIYGATLEGMTDKTIIYALSDGAKNCWKVLSVLSKHCAKMINILDWEHIGRKFKHAEQSLPADYHKQLESAKWKLWHGQSKCCLEKLNEIKNNFKGNAAKQLDTLIEYITNNIDTLINYEKQRNLNLPYTSNVIESAIGSLINERQKINKKMSWTREGAHNILQIRASIASRTWNEDWNNAVEVLLAA